MTRYNVTANGLEEAGSQTMAFGGPQGGGIAPGGTTTLNFDRLGAGITLGQNYTAGDLNNVEVGVSPPPAPPSPPTGAEDEAPALAFSIGTAEGAGAALAGIDATLGRMTRMEGELQGVQAAQRKAVTDAFSGLKTPDLTPEGAAGVEQDLRTALRQQAAAALLSQAGLSPGGVQAVLG